MTLKATPNTTSSLGSADGPTRSGSVDGQTTDQSGPDHAPVSRSAMQEVGKAFPTNDTCGPLFNASSPSVRLQSSLESRLRARLDVNGSPEYALIWKHWDMPSGPPICRLRASAHRTSDKGFGGWPTPMAGTPAQKGYNEAGNNDSSRKTVAMVSGWPTPTSKEAAGGEYADPMKAPERVKGPHANDLRHFAKLAGWATPTTRDHKDTGKLENVPVNSLLGRQVALSPAPTEKRGVLNPAFSLWLMGFPTVWARCAVQVTRSSRKSRRNS